MEHLYIDSPLGPLHIVATQRGVCALDFVQALRDNTPTPSALLQETAIQLEEYFEKKRRHFDIPIAPMGTAFQVKVWNLLCEIPYGRLVSYTDIALRYGDRRSAMLVGAACSRNPLPIIIPCHRIVGSNGNLSSYSAGLYRKEWLLVHENTICPQGKQLTVFG